MHDPNGLLGALTPSTLIATSMSLTSSLMKVHFRMRHVSTIYCKELQ